MKNNLSKFMVAAAGCSALVASPLLAEKAGQLTDINGMDAGSAESALMSRGFKNISSHRNTQGYVNSYWWDGATDDCVVVEVYQRSNRVESINDATDQDCGHHKGDGAAAAAGVVAGAALLGVLVGSGKSHHKERQQYDAAQTAEFDRGYSDGLYNGSYHNYNRSDAYSKGYEKGVDERVANLSHHQRRGGYSSGVQFKDLIGSRAAGGMDELQRRGFRQVDNFVSGNARYSVQYREASRQCIQVITADGRLENITDIQTHPNCRSGYATQLPSNIAPDIGWFQRLVGASGSGAEVQMGNNGFRRVDRFESGRNGYGTVWYSRSTRQCLQMITVNGRVDSAVDIQTHPKCR